MGKNEQADQLSEADYGSVFNAANDAILIHDIETYRIVDINAKACEMFCYPKEEMIRLDLKDIISGDPTYSYENITKYVKMASDGESQLFEWLSKDKAGRPFWVDINLKRAVISGKYRLIAIVRDINDRKQNEEFLTRINEAFLSFNADSSENINRLITLCGELVGADCVLYNRLEGDQLRSCGRWHAPEDMKMLDNAEGHICTDVIKNLHDDVVVLRNLPETGYAKTDAAILLYGLKTYVGRAVKFGNKYRGTVCALYKYDFVPSEDDKRIMSIIAAAIGSEEERNSAEEASRLAQFSIDTAGEAIFWIKGDGRILYANGMTCRYLGYSHEELMRMSVGDLDPNLSGKTWADFREDVKVRGSFTFESTARKKDGGTVPIETTVNYLEFHGEEYICGFSRNITERKSAGDALLKRDYQLDILSRTSQHINAVLDLPVILRTLVAAAMELVDATAGAAGLMEDGHIVFNECNKAGHVEPVKCDPGECNGADWIIQTRKAYISNDAEHDARIAPGKAMRLGIYNLACVPILNGKGELLGCFEIYNKTNRLPFDTQDIFMLQGLAAGAAVALVNAKMLIERKASEDALRDSEKRYRISVENMPMLLTAIDTSGKFTMWNKHAERMLGYANDEVVGKMVFADIQDSREEAKAILRLATKEDICDRTIKLVHKKGNIIFAHLVVVPYKDAESNILGFYGFAEDVTKRMKAEAEQKRLHEELVKSNKKLKQLALKDGLTGLYNHHYLSETVETEFYRAKRYVHPLSIIMLDIDYFKSINDVYGYDFGDLVLIQFAKHLKKAVGAYDIVIRVGGAQFIILSMAMDRARIINLAHKLLEDINLHNFGDGKHAIKLKVSVSVYSYPEDNSTDGMDLVTHADKLLRKVKEAGGNRVYSSSDVKKPETAGAKASGSKEVKILKDEIDKLTRSGKQNLIESIFAFAKTIELKDHCTGEHVERTVRYSTEVAKALGLSAEETENIRQASILHDLGKIGISDKILLKKGKLTKAEFEEIKKHPQIAADIIRPIQFMHDIMPLILYHHERWDGKGYPAGLKGEAIPIGARIISIADVYQALTSDRPYRKGFAKKDAIKMVKEGRGTQFDPNVVDVFLDILKKER